MKEKQKKRNKLYFICVSVIIIIALLIPFVFAVSNQPIKETNSKSFFTVDSLEKTPGSTLEMCVNLDLISYDKFIFTLTNMNDMTNIDTDQLSVEDNIEIEKQNNGITVTGDKEKLQMNQIKFFYIIPEDISIGTTITFKAEIEEDSQIEEEKIKNEVNVNDENKVMDANNLNEVNEINSKGNLNQTNDENTESIKEKENNKQSIEITIKIVESKEEQSLVNNQENKDNQENLKNNELVKNENNTNSSSTNKSSSTQQVSSQISSQSQSVTYKGSSNNYLKTLTIDGYTFNQEFSKTNTTYFLTLTDGNDTLKVNAVAEDENATICIYGNNQLENEINKILISVTAENGDVRIYRVYVTK